jgi:hypothetical protein
MARELAHGKLVKPGDRDLAGVGVPRKNQRNPLLPERISFFCDVRKADDRQVAPEAFQCLAPIRVPGVRVVKADEL